jgi:hypothetical protein
VLVVDDEANRRILVLQLARWRVTATAVSEAAKRSRR